MILKSRSEIIIRIPIVPGFNDDENHLERLKQFLIENKTENIKKINLLPFHKIGSSKYKRFNLPYRMDNVKQPSNERMKELKEFFSNTDVKVKIGG
jgi:pyruvate formate lyase activating enzyme